MIEKHGLGGSKMIECNECGSFLSSKQALERHILKIHRVCKICKLEFKTDVEKNNHQQALKILSLAHFLKVFDFWF
jgi:transcription elongation factor Elf1